MYFRLKYEDFMLKYVKHKNNIESDKIVKLDLKD